MFEVQDAFKLGTETLLLAVSMLRRFLSRQVIPRADLQLAGTTALFIASKVEELRPKPLSDFVFIAADTYTRDQIISTETDILRALGYRVSTFPAFESVFMD